MYINYVYLALVKVLPNAHFICTLPRLRSIGDQDAMEKDEQDAAARKWCPNPLDLIINNISYAMSIF